MLKKGLLLIITLCFIIPTSIFAKTSILKNLGSSFTIISDNINSCIAYKGKDLGICLSEKTLESIPKSQILQGICDKAIGEKWDIVYADLSSSAKKSCARESNITRLIVKHERYLNYGYAVLQKIMYEGGLYEYLFSTKYGTIYRIPEGEYLLEIKVGKSGTYILSGYQRGGGGGTIQLIDKYTGKIRTIFSVSDVNEPYSAGIDTKSFDVIDFELLPERKIQIRLRESTIGSTQNIVIKIIKI